MLQAPLSHERGDSVGCFMVVSQVCPPDSTSIALSCNLLINSRPSELPEWVGRTRSPWEKERGTQR